MTASRKSLRLEALLWLLVMVAAIVLSTVLLLRNHRLEKELSQLRDDHQALTAETAGLREQLAEARQKAHNRPGLLDWEIEELRKKGLTNPADDLGSDLQEHPELIPHPGVLGGTMAFGFPEKIHMLTDRWVLAYFEDGHIAGWMLLEYQVARGGKITWRRIDSYVE
jgi:hypothetical protein